MSDKSLSPEAHFDCLIRRWWPMVRGLSRDWEIPGMEIQDVEQEGLIALMEAARRFDESKGVSFARFASVVVRLRFRDCQTKATRQKHAPLNSAVVSVLNKDGGRIDMLELLPDKTPQPQDIAEARERLRALAAAIEHDLTFAERTALRGVMNEMTYDEIATAVHVGGSGRRYVDNAIQRARRKLAKV